MKEWMSDVGEFIIGLLLIPVLIGYGIIDYILKATERKNPGDD